MYLLCCNVEVWSKGNGSFETPAIFFNEIEVNCTHKTLVLIKNICLRERGRARKENWQGRRESKRMK